MGVINLLNSAGSAFSRSMTFATGGASIHQGAMDQSDEKKGLSSLKALRGAKGVGAFAAIGAAAGASATLGSDGSIDPITGALVGGAIGAAALPAIGLTTGLVGRAGVGAIKSLPKAAEVAGNGFIGATIPTMAVGATMATDLAAMTWGIGKNLVGMDTVADKIADVKITGPISGAKLAASEAKGINKLTKGAKGALINGKTVLGAASLFSGVKSAYGSMQKHHMGQYMGAETMTSRTPNYSNNAGATGDLVFALNKNRHG